MNPTLKLVSQGSPQWITTWLGNYPGPPKMCPFSGLSPGPLTGHCMVRVSSPPPTTVTSHHTSSLKHPQLTLSLSSNHLTPAFSQSLSQLRYVPASIINYSSALKPVLSFALTIASSFTVAAIFDLSTLTLTNVVTHDLTDTHTPLCLTDVTYLT